MPFGAEVLDGGAVRFRLWAPAAERVNLEILEGERGAHSPMTRGAEGWHEVVARGAGPGTRYRFDVGRGRLVPDPASRYQPQDVNGPSEVIDPEAYEWQDGAWRGRPWEEAVVYEIHVGTFTPQGTFRAAIERLAELAELGLTAIEVMPVADFPGTRNWGYDGVLPFAPDSCYGRPEDLKALIDAAHALGLMVLLDVVYNHFGPEGNYLHFYAPQFSTDRHHTPWGAAINFDGDGSRVVREFFVHNALYWLEEFHFDGLRLDAADAIADESEPDILIELAQRVRRGPGRTRHVHLVLENYHNAARYLARDEARPCLYDAQWNDDFHHALHVLVTGERDAHYADYAGEPVRLLARALAEGYAYQGEHSVFRGRLRGEPSTGLPPCAFVNFLQNHDQVGNRAFGERLTTLVPPEAVRAALALLLLAPSIPLMFMGEEFGCTQPFPFFCDFRGDLARAVAEGRRGAFVRFERFRDPVSRAAILDPNDASTFALASIDWTSASRPENAAWRTFVKGLLSVRRASILPRIRELLPGGGRFATEGETALFVEWRCRDGSRLAVAANFGRHAIRNRRAVEGELIHAQPAHAVEQLSHARLGPWSVIWTGGMQGRP